MNESAEALLSELDEFFKSASLSEEGIREIFKRHGLTPNDNNYWYINIFLWACRNERVTEGIIRCFIEYFPGAARTSDEDGFSPLHFACYNKSSTRGIIQLLIDAAPDSARSATNGGSMPLHILCACDSIDDTVAIQILELLIEKNPESVRRVHYGGRLPIHIAAKVNSPEFCRVLIEAYPGSERIADSMGLLPLHYACRCNTFATMEYFYKLYPDAVNHATTDELYPIHVAIAGVCKRVDPEGSIKTVQYLLNCDPNVKLQKFGGKSLLHVACGVNFDDSNIDAALEVVKLIYDAHPEFIEENRITSDIQHYHQQVQAFINSELVYARQAKDHRLITTPDDNGRLPLHTALQDNVRLGSIKLLVKGNPSAIRNFDDSGAIPLHIACEHHDSASVVGYMISLSGITLDTTDRKGNTALHYACRGAKYDTIALLLDNFDAVSVSKRNVDEKLPIDLLWESNEVLDRASVGYTESVYRLLRAHPETTMSIGLQMQSISVSSPSISPSPNGKKRKFGHGYK